MKGVQWTHINKHKEQVEKLLNGKTSFVVFDTETTGLPGKDGLTEESVKIVQFSAVRYHFKEDGDIEEIDSYNTYINPLEPMTEGAMKATGITPELLRDAPLEKMVCKEIIDYMKQESLWLAFNAQFDINRLFYMAQRNKYYDYYPKETLDVLEMAHCCFCRESEDTACQHYEGKKKLNCSKDEKDHAKSLNNHKLATMIEKFCPGYEAKFHDSLEDVRATAILFECFLKIYKECLPEKEGLQKRTLKRIDFQKNQYVDRNGIKQYKKDGRIRVFTEEDVVPFGKSSIIFDMERKVWTCTSESKAKKYFEQTDMQALENDIIIRYGREYGTGDIWQLGFGMDKKFRDQMKAKEISEKAKIAVESAKNAIQTMSNDKLAADAKSNESYDIDFE